MAVANSEAAVNFEDGFCLAGAQNGFVKVLHQHVVQLAQMHRPAIVLLHKLFYGKLAVAVGKAKLFGQRALVIK